MTSAAPTAVWWASLGAYVELLERRKLDLEEERADPIQDLKLHRWIRHQINNHRAGYLSPIKVVALDQAVPGWNEVTIYQWDHEFHHLAEFILRERATPRLGGSRNGENRAAAFLTEQRRLKVMEVHRIDKFRHLAAQTEIPPLLGPRKLASTHIRKTALRVAAFRAEHAGTWPTIAATNVDERELAWFISALRRAHGAEELTPALKAKVDAAIPGWLEPLFPARIRPAERAVMQIAHFVTEYERLPTHGVSRDRYERKLGYILAEARQARRGRSKMTPHLEEVIALLDRLVPTWRGAREHSHTPRLRDFSESCALLRAHVEKHHRLPTVRAEDAETARLAQWLSKQRTKGRRGELSREHRSMLDAATPLWDSAPRKSRCRPVS